MKLLKKIFLAFAVAGILAAGGLWAFRFRIAGLLMTSWGGQRKSVYLERSPESSLLRHQKTILEDADLLARRPFFSRPTGGTSEAAPFLNPLVSWPQRPGPLALSKTASDLVATKAFVSARPDWKTLGLDFSWFSRLREFDHWSFDTQGPVYGPEVSYTVPEAPLPEYGELRNWARLRLLRGRDEDDEAKAFQEVRQLAWLIWTNENLVATTVALSVLEAERLVFESLDEKRRARLQSPPFSSDELNRARRFFFAQRAFVDLRLSDELESRLSSVRVGLCQRVQEGIYNSLGLRKLGRLEFASAYERLGRLVASSASVCRDGFLRRMWQNPDYEGLLKHDQPVFGTDSTPEWRSSFLNVTVADVEKHPEVALPLYYLLLGISEPNALRWYEEDPNRP